MASYFGKRDFGDPRHNFVPRVMDYEKATGKVFVPKLWGPQAFPGQVSYPVLHNNRIPGVSGSHRGRYDRNFVPRSAQSAKGSHSARATLQHSRSAAALETPPRAAPPPPMSSRPASSKRVSFDSAAMSPTPAMATSARSMYRLSARRPLKRDPSISTFTAAGVAELVKAGFPPEAALAAFLKATGQPVKMQMDNAEGTPTGGTGARDDVVQYI